MSFARAIEANWGTKFGAAIDITDPEAKSLFEELKAIKSELRNPLAHGGFGTRNTSLFFHLPGIAAVPIMMRDHKAVFRPFSPTIMTLGNFAAACDLFDRFEAYLDRSTARYGYRFARTGLDVDFSKRARREYAKSMMNDELFNDFIEHKSDEHERHMNMDY